MPGPLGRRWAMVRRRLHPRWRQVLGSIRGWSRDREIEFDRCKPCSVEGAPRPLLPRSEPAIHCRQETLGTREAQLPDADAKGSLVGRWRIGHRPGELAPDSLNERRDCYRAVLKGRMHPRSGCQEYFLPAVGELGCSISETGVPGAREGHVRNENEVIAGDLVFFHYFCQLSAQVVENCLSRPFHPLRPILWNFA
jgi:hypothetical protein